MNFGKGKQVAAADDMTESVRVGCGGSDFCVALMLATAYLNTSAQQCCDLYRRDLSWTGLEVKVFPQPEASMQ